MTTEPHTVTKKLAEMAQRLHQAHLAQRAGSGQEAKETDAEPMTAQDAALESATAATGASIWQRRVSALASLGEDHPEVES